MPFEIPSRIQSRLDRKAAPTRKQAEEHSEIVLISELAEYRAAHPELVFTGRFDLQGRPLWTPQSPEPFTERQSR